MQLKNIIINKNSPFIEWGEFNHLEGQKFENFQEIRTEIEKDTAKRRPPRDRANQNNDGDMNPPPREMGPDGPPPHPPRDKDGRPLHPPRDKDGKPMHPPRDGKGHPPPPPDEM